MSSRSLCISGNEAADALANRASGTIVMGTEPLWNFKECYKSVHIILNKNGANCKMDRSRWSKDEFDGSGDPYFTTCS